MSLTVDDVKAAFQSAIPRRRDEFAVRVQAHLQTIVHVPDYQARYVREVLRMAESEIRARSDIATKRIEDLLNSGWRPQNKTDVHATYLAMYSGFDHWQKDPSSDLYEIITSSFGSVGLNSPETSIEYVRRLGAVQVQASEEAVLSLNVYAAKFIDLSTTTAAPAATSTASIVLGATARVGYPAPIPFRYHVFISHASPDKDSFVRPLAKALADRGLQVWYDEQTLRIGDSLHEKIDDGLKSSKHGIVVLSKAFFKKSWPREELAGLFRRQTSENTNVILPIWLDVTADEVAAYNTILAGRVAANSSDGIESIVTDIMEVVVPAQVF